MRDLHMLRMAVLLYHELTVHDRDLHSLRSAVLLYREFAVYARRNIHFAGEEGDFSAIGTVVFLYLHNRTLEFRQ